MCFFWGVPKLSLDFVATSPSWMYPFYHFKTDGKSARFNRKCRDIDLSFSLAQPAEYLEIQM